LSCPSVSIPQGPTGQNMEGINLGLLLEGGSGAANFQKSEGPAWITVDSNGYLWGTRPNTPQDKTTLKVLATDEVHPELQLLISIPVDRVYRALSGELVLEGNAWYSGSNVSPNVLTAAFLSINAPSPDDLTYFWYRNNKLVKSGKGVTTYPIYNIDDKCVIKCEVTADGMVGHLSASVTLGLAPGPAAPEVQPHAYAGWDGNPTGYIEVINGEYPLELSTSVSFASPLATIQEGNFLNLSMGTYYVRCAATRFRNAGSYRKVTLSASNALTILPRADKIPWGTYGTATSEDREYEYLIEVVGGKPPFDFEIYDGPWPEALQYNEATYDRTGAYCSIYKKQDDVPIPRNSRYAYITGRYPNEGYGNFGRVTVMVTDGNGDRAYQQFFFEGWDHDTETENFADLGIVHDFPELTYGYVPGEDTEAIVYMINRGCNEIDKTQLSYRVTYPEYDDTEGFIEVDVTDWFEFYTIKNSDTIPRATYDEVHIRAKAGIRPDFHVLNFYIDGINGAYEGQNKKELSLKVNPVSLDKCTVEPVPDVVYDGTWQEPEIVIRDGNGVQLVQNDDFYVSYHWNREVGTAEWTATALNESSYAPYIGSVSGTFQILKAEGEDRYVELYAPSDWKNQLEFDLYNHIPVYYGLRSLELLSVSDPLGLLKPGSVSNDFNLLRLTPSNVDSEGCECSVTFRAKCSQVEDFELNVVICFSGGEEPILNVKPYAKTYDGQPVRIEDLKLSATVDGVPVAGQWSFAAPDDDLLLVNAHSTEEVLLRFQPEDTDAYIPVYEYLELTIWQAPVTGEPVWELEEAKMGAWPLWKFHLSAEGGSFSVPGHVEWDEPGQNVQPNVAYEWTFYPDNQSYEYHTGYIVLWPRDKKAPTLHVENYQKYYDGKTVTVNDITKSATYNGKAVPGSWSFPNVTDDEELTVKMDNWGRYEKIIRFTPSSSEYCTVDARLWLEIKPGRVTGEPNYTRIYEAGHTLADVELSEFGGSFSTAGHVSFDVSDDSPVLLDIPYNWTFYPDDDNYDPLYGSLVPWRSKEPVELTVQPFAKTYDSKRVTVDQLTKTAKFEGKTVSGSWSFVKPNDPLLTNAHGQEPVMLRFTPSDSKLA
ncbi:MAG: hypothetical protein II062_07625, partial [Oscillospiraceae bacterium]|nr:hypothetical protein [Oscillospiraceae bacterium]